jgi:hypothetical protein
MNQKDVKKREILDYKEFMKVSNDPWNPKNLSKEDRTGFHKIKPEAAYDHAGYKDAVFNGTSKIDVPGYGATESGSASSFGTQE